MAWNEKRRVKHAYDVTADMYDERYGEEQNRKYRVALERVGVSGRMVLDVGCGSGMLFSHLASEAKMVVGVDLSHGLLLKANARARGFSGFFVVQADADHLPFVDGLFDAVFALTMLQNMPNPALTLAELSRAVRAGGKVVVTGLKKAFKLEEFMDLLENSGLQVEAFVDDEAVNCYIAVLTA
jgi:phosphatidylethanolamine/phosphatidyl-N-methylethanolamine N-methyltransferase